MPPLSTLKRHTVLSLGVTALHVCAWVSVRRVVQQKREWNGT
jgi:hypothetical protein